MQINGFYKKGVSATVGGSGGINPRTFAPSTSSIDIGYKPKGGAKVVEDPAHEVISHSGVNYLALNKGHVYDVQFSGEWTNSQRIDATSGHAVIELAPGAKVESAKAVQYKSEE